MIINLRGTSGSGKTTAVKKILELYPSVEVENGHRVDIPGHDPLYIVGPYKTSCSGCDRMQSQDLICKTIRKFAKKGDVLFEGYRVSGSVERYVSLLKELSNHQGIFLFMDTPLKKCLSRLHKRRKKNNLKKPLSAGHVVSTFKRLQRMPEVLREAGMPVQMLSHKSPTEGILSHLKKRFPRYTNRVIMNPRGTNGSGKSTVMFDLMKTFGKDEILNEEGKIIGYKVKCYPPLYIVGNYSTPTGGVDTIRTMDIVCERIANFAKKGDVIFEGLLVSGFHGRWVDLEKKLPHCKFIYGVMDTPLETCIERVVQRRKEAGNEKPFDPKNLKAKHRSVQSSRLALIKAGSDVRTVPHDKPMKTFLRWRSEAQTRFPRLKEGHR